MRGRRAEERIVGLVRFSYLSRSGFSRDFPDLEARQAYLNDPDRLERRFRMFQALALPSLLRQTDPGFRCIFLIGTGLDPLARQRLEDLVAPLPGAAVIALPSRRADHIQAPRAWTVPPHRAAALTSSG